MTAETNRQEMLQNFDLAFTDLHVIADASPVREEVPARVEGAPDERDERVDRV
jgi:hypothetical protein